LKALTSEFSERTGITAELETVVFRNRLDEDAKIALFRVAQEALTNIERHADATHVAIRIAGHKRGATLRIQDNGRGFQPEETGGGLGLRNMQERIEQLDGTLRILSSASGTVIEAEVPLTHLLRPDTASRESA
jgi:two-component system NarL family sensor kinase